MRIFTPENMFTRSYFLLILTLFLLPTPVFGDWSIDLSRRQGEMRSAEMEQPSVEEQKGSFFDLILHQGEPLQEVVIIKSHRGFVPEKLRLREGGRYKIHIVNVDKENKNISFVLDAFSEHHGTYYGDTVSFEIEPKKTGVFSFHCPETASEGQLVVFKNTVTGPDYRQPASLGD